jgi:hypothetical protein
VALWRFDQGRLDYFQYDEIKRIAHALVEVNGIPKPNINDDILRQTLLKYSPRPFSPNNYTVWRNYKRVFGCLLLATEVAGRIVCTDLCKILATDLDVIDIDDYMRHFATRFYYPSPVFDGYNCTDHQTFPVIAIIKFLLSEYLVRGKASITVDEIGNYLLANDVTGLEPLSFYSTLKPKSFNGDLRQTRELIRFISQFSFLKWNKPSLYFEASNKDEAFQIEELLAPQLMQRQPDPEAEVLNLGSDFQGTALGDLTISQINIVDAEFTEGSKIGVTHLRSERSAKLKDFYFSNTINPHICDMCSIDTEKRYPWADRIIELHHLLPLCSPVRVDAGKTSIKDIAGMCPSCHRATHKFYSKWLKSNGLKDFKSYEEALNVYNEAKREIVLI